MNMHNKKKNKLFNLMNDEDLFLNFVILKFNELKFNHPNKDNSKTKF